MALPVPLLLVPPDVALLDGLWEVWASDHVVLQPRKAGVEAAWHDDAWKMQDLARNDCLLDGDWSRHGQWMLVWMVKEA